MSTDLEDRGNMEGISELLRCYICMERLTKATVCPHCSKLGCFACIKRWVTDNRSDCPHCRNPLTVADLIKIPLFDDLGLVLDNLHASTQDVTLSKESDNTCCTHHEKMSVYCETCKECICHKCALWSAPHCGHTFKPLDDLYKRHVEILQGELAKLNERLRDIVGQVQQVERKMEAVKLNKSKAKKEMTHVVEKTCHRLDDLAKERIDLLEEFHGYLCNQAVEITKESHDLEKTISVGNVSTLVNSNGDLKTDVSTTIKRLLAPYQKMEALPTIAHFVNEVVPEYDSAIFKISSFRELQRRGKEIYSESLHLQGLVWRLKVYPNGHKEEVENYLAVFVELSEGYRRVTNYQYCIEMLYGCSNKSPHRNHKREYASDFADGESWGYLKYYELSHLQEDGFLKDNTLMLKFHVRAPTYYQKYQDQNLYLQKVMKERNALKQQVQSTKQQMSTLKSEYKVLLSEHRSCTHVNSSNSCTAPIQHPSHTPLTLHSSQHHHLPRQSHSHSTHQEHPHPRRERNTSHMIPEKAHHRALLPHPALSHHSSPTHSRSHSNNTPSSLSSHSESQRLHGEAARLLPVGDPSMASSQMLPGVGRQMAHEKSPELSIKVAEQRRKSVDSAFLQEQEMRGHHNYSRRRDHSRTQLDPAPIAKTKSKVEELSGNDDPESGYSHALNPADIIITLNDEEEDVEGDRSKSNSSCSTLIESGSPPREVKEKLSEPSPPTARQQQNMQQELSQEQFGDDDHKENEMITLAEGHGTLMPLSNCQLSYEPYYGEYQEGFPPHLFTTKLEQNQSLFQSFSQSSSSSPPKSRHGKSLTDLTSSNGSLSCSQPFLSQSMADFQHTQQRQESSRQVATSQRHPREHRFRGPPLSHMSSDPHLNSTHIPGLQRSIIHALSGVKEEVGLRKQHSRGKKRSPSMLQSSPQSQPHRSPHSSSALQNKHLKATVIRKSSQRRISPNSSPHDKKKMGTSSPLAEPEGRQAASRGSEVKSSQAKQTPTTGAASRIPAKVDLRRDLENKESDAHPHPATFGNNTLTESSRQLQSKSNSTTSLNNLSLIL